MRSDPEKNAPKGESAHPTPDGDNDSHGDR